MQHTANETLQDVTPKLSNKLLSIPGPVYQSLVREEEAHLSGGFLAALREAGIPPKKKKKKTQCIKLSNQESAINQVI